MTKNSYDFLYLYGCAVSGSMPKENKHNKEDDYNLEELFKIAKQHEVWAIFFLAVKKLYNEKRIPQKYAGTFPVLNKKFISEIAFNMKKTDGAYKLCDILEKNGIECCVLKGDSAAIYYDVPESRISSDIDILINEKDENKAMEILSNSGCEVLKREKKDHHFQAIYDGKYIMEVHITLYGKTTQEIILQNKVSYSDRFETFKLKNGRTLKTLSLYDNLVFLTAHFIKHFMFSGVGIRQISDLLMFADKNKENIDFEKYFNLLKEINFFKLISVVFKIGNDYFNTNLPVECELNDDITALLLDDIFSGGVFGGGKARGENFSRYLAKKMSSSAGKYSVPLIKKIFPSYSQMRFMYPFLNEKPYLLPIAHILRYKQIIVRFFTKRHETEEKNKKTVEFLKKFDIL